MQTPPTRVIDRGNLKLVLQIHTQHKKTTAGHIRLAASYTHKKEGVSSRQPNLYLTLKSNTMKNTLQKYCFFATPPNVLAKKCVK